MQCAHTCVVVCPLRPGSIKSGCTAGFRCQQTVAASACVFTAARVELYEMYGYVGPMFIATVFLMTAGLVAGLTVLFFDRPRLLACELYSWRRDSGGSEFGPL